MFQASPGDLGTFPCVCVCVVFILTVTLIGLTDASEIKKARHGCGASF
jgi:hypothetical protein